MLCNRPRWRKRAVVEANDRLLYNPTATSSAVGKRVRTVAADHWPFLQLVNANHHHLPSLYPTSEFFSASSHRPPPKHRHKSRVLLPATRPSHLLRSDSQGNLWHPCVGLDGQESPLLRYTIRMIIHNPHDHPRKHSLNFAAIYL